MLIEAVGLAMRFGDRPLFSEVNLSLSEGEVVALTGPSGSGKSTMLAILAGWISPSAGHVTRSAKRVVWVLQNPHGTPARTAMDHVVLPLLAQGFQRKDAEPIALDILSRFNLALLASRRFSTLSGGEAQRLMLAAASATDAELLFVDEPTAQLDPEASKLVREVIAGLSGEGRAVVVATHDPLLAQACDRDVSLGPRG